MPRERASRKADDTVFREGSHAVTLRILSPCTTPKQRPRTGCSNCIIRMDLYYPENGRSLQDSLGAAHRRADVAALGECLVQLGGPGLPRPRLRLRGTGRHAAAAA